MPKPEFLYGKNGKLYKKTEESSDSEQEVTPPKKTVKNIAKHVFESDSESEQDVPVKKSSKKVEVESDDEILAPPPRKVTEAKKAKAKKEKKTKETSRKRKVSPAKKSKKSKKEIESESESESDDEVLDTPLKLRAARKEMLSEEEMKKNTEEYLAREYKRCCTFKRWYEKEYKKNENEEPWEKASKLFTNAAATLVKYRGLQKAKIADDSHLHKAIPQLKASGEASFAEALKIVSSLNKEDAAKFWKEQVRNKNAKCFEDLVTKKDYEREQLAAQIRAEIEQERNEQEEEDV